MIGDQMKIEKTADLWENEFSCINLNLKYNKQ